MNHKAKCRLCGSIMEYPDGKRISCKCGEVVLDGAENKVRCMKSDVNFVEVDDLGNEISQQVVGLSDKPKREELLKMLDTMINDYDKLPANAMSSGVTHYDLAAALLLLSSILRSE